MNFRIGLGYFCAVLGVVLAITGIVNFILFLKKRNDPVGEDEFSPAKNHLIMAGSYFLIGVGLGLIALFDLEFISTDLPGLIITLLGAGLIYLKTRY